MSHGHEIARYSGDLTCDALSAGASLREFLKNVFDGLLNWFRTRIITVWAKGKQKMPWAQLGFEPRTARKV